MNHVFQNLEEMSSQNESYLSFDSILSANISLMSEICNMKYGGRDTYL